MATAGSKGRQCRRLWDSTTMIYFLVITVCGPLVALQNGWKEAKHPQIVINCIGGSRQQLYSATELANCCSELHSLSLSNLVSSLSLKTRYSDVLRDLNCILGHLHDP